MDWLKRFLGSTIGLKAVMAVSGVMLVGFVIAHMLGNLQVFMGREVFNHYGDTLQSLGELLWIMRLGLLGAVVAHIASAVALILRSKAARPQGYKKHALIANKYAARTMRYGGLIVLAFIVYHLLHLTVGNVHSDFVAYAPTGTGGVAGDAYHNLTVGLAHPAVAGFYILANVFLGLHLWHGVWSLCRTLGLGNPRWDAVAGKTATGIALLVSLGNISIPIAVLAGIVG